MWLKIALYLLPFFLTVTGALSQQSSGILVLDFVNENKNSEEIDKAGERFGSIMKSAVTSQSARGELFIVERGQIPLLDRVIKNEKKLRRFLEKEAVQQEIEVARVDYVLYGDFRQDLINSPEAVEFYVKLVRVLDDGTTNGQHKVFSLSVRDVLVPETCEDAFVNVFNELLKNIRESSPISIPERDSNAIIPAFIFPAIASAGLFTSSVLIQNKSNNLYHTYESNKHPCLPIYDNRSRNEHYELANDKHKLAGWLRAGGLLTFSAGALLWIRHQDRKRKKKRKKNTNTLIGTTGSSLVFNLTF